MSLIVSTLFFSQNAELSSHRDVPEIIRINRWAYMRINADLSVVLKQGVFIVIIKFIYLFECRVVIPCLLIWHHCDVCISAILQVFKASSLLNRES